MCTFKTLSLAGCCIFVATYSTGASAALGNQGVLDQVVTEFMSRAASWQAVIEDAATWLFWTLGTISLVWTFAVMALRKGDLTDFFAEFVRFILFFGFYLWLLRNGPEFASSIIQSLQHLGERASGVAVVTPSSIVDIGFMLWKQSLKGLSFWDPVDSFVGLLLSLMILVMLALIAINMLMVLISGWILIYAGVIYLGFGGSRWTSDLAINYYKTVLGLAIQLFGMVLLVGVGADLLEVFYSRMSKGPLNFEELAVMLIVTLALLLLTHKVPSVLAGIITGSSIANGNIGTAGAAAAVGAAMTAAGMATSIANVAKAAGVGNIMSGAAAVEAAVRGAQRGSDNQDFNSFFTDVTAQERPSESTSPFGQSAFPDLHMEPQRPFISGLADRPASAEPESPGQSENGSDGPGARKQRDVDDYEVQIPEGLSKELADEIVAFVKKDRPSWPG